MPATNAAPNPGKKPLTVHQASASSYLFDSKLFYGADGGTNANPRSWANHSSTG